MVSLGSVILNVSEDTPGIDVDITRNKIAGTARTKNHNNGIKNRKWSLKCWTTSESEHKAIEALAGQKGLIFTDKYGDKYTVSIVSISPARKHHHFLRFTMRLEEDE